MYIDGLKLRDLRSFASTSMRFNHPDRPEGEHLNNVTLIVGVNGAGKTTILRSVALAVLGETLNSTGFIPRAFVRRVPETEPTSEGSATLVAQLVAHASDAPSGGIEHGAMISSEVTIRRKGMREVFDVTPESEPSIDDSIGSAFQKQAPTGFGIAPFTMLEAQELLYDDRSPSYFMVGYATNRIVEGSATDPSLRSKRRLPRYDRVAGLFEESTGLVPLATWLPDLRTQHGDRFSEVVQLIDDLLPGMTFEGEVGDEGEIVFVHKGSRVPFNAMSDGYKSYIGWIGDLLYHLNVVADPSQPLSDVPGLVLIDEVDAHLHAEWQREIIPKVSATFQRLQFIATTHSPMVVGTVRAANLIHVAPSGEGNATIAEPVTTELYGRNANQILLSELFGLDSTRSAVFVDALAKRAEAAAKGDLAAAEELSELAAYGIAGAEQSGGRRRADEVNPSPEARAALGDLAG